ncbi:MAG: hypothetical protein E6I91_20250 [Chloroflexi bacterium]|nr:MAG: hypothetical protein E6I91_20250 [Chloroflexota bacterium]
MPRANQLAFIGIKLSWEVRQEAGRSVGARVVDVGLGGPLWSPADGVAIMFLQEVSPGEQDAGDHKGPPICPSSTLAPTDHPGQFR